MSKLEEIRKGAANKNPDALLEMSKGEFKEVFIIGYGLGGELVGKPSSGIADPASLIFLMEQIKQALLLGLYDHVEKVH